MIFDRTDADRKAASAIREEKVKKFLALTADEVAQLERGFVTVNTLNRIEDAEADLKDLFDAYGVTVGTITTKTWTDSGYFDSADFARILDNLRALKTAFYSLKTTPKVPGANWKYQTWNAIEKILYDLTFLVNGMAANFIYSDEIYAGEW